MQLPRSLTRFMFAAALPLAFACAPEEEATIGDTEEAAETTPPAAQPPAPTTPMSTPMTAQFTALNESGLAGDIQVTGEGEQTRVVAQLTGGTAGSVHQGHIHTGTCESPGTVVAPLQAVTIGDDGTGRAESTAPVAPATSMNGQHIVLYHEAGGSPGAPVACAVIPAHTM